eukprot:PhF_6_TR923/c1_g1_i3/m.1571
MDMLLERARTPSWLSRVRTDHRVASTPFRPATPLRPQSGPIGPQKDRPSRPVTAPPIANHHHGSSNSPLSSLNTNNNNNNTAVNTQRLVLDAEDDSSSVTAVATKTNSLSRVEATTTQQPPQHQQQNWSLSEHASEDQFSQKERSIMKELNKVRADPQGFGVVLRSQGLVEPPFVESSCTMDVAVQRLNDKRKELTAVLQELSVARDVHTKEVTVLKAQWVQQDADRAKLAHKSGGGGASSAASKPGAKGANTSSAAKAMEESMHVEIADAREAQLKAMEEALKVRMATREKHAEKLKSSIGLMEDGLSRYNQLLKTLAQHPTALPAVKASRGLSLASRDRCLDIEKVQHAITTTHSSLCKIDPRYGLSVGASYLAFCVGVRTPAECVLQLLLDPTFQKFMLDPSVSKVGCGWRRHPVHQAVTVMILSQSFQESLLSVSNAHLPLQVVRHLVDKVSNNNHQNAPHEITFSNPAIVALRPAFHPIECSNETSLLLRCPPEIQVAASFAPIQDSAAITKPNLNSDLFVERDGGSNLKIHLVFPSEGRFVLKLFVVGGGKNTLVGCVDFVVNQWNPIGMRAAYPDFMHTYGERNITLFSPLSNPLKAGQVIMFQLDIPTMESAGFRKSYREDCQRKTALLTEELQKAQTQFNKDNEERQATIMSLQKEIQGLKKKLESVDSDIYHVHRELRPGAHLSIVPGKSTSTSAASPAKKLDKSREKELSAQLVTLNETKHTVESSLATLETKCTSLMKAGDDLKQLISHKRSQLRLIEQEMGSSAALSQQQQQLIHNGPPSVVLRFGGGHSTVLYSTATSVGGVYQFKSQVRVRPGSQSVSLFVDGDTVVQWKVVD